MLLVLLFVFCVCKYTKNFSSAAPTPSQHPHPLTKSPSIYTSLSAKFLRDDILFFHSIPQVPKKRHPIILFTLFPSPEGTIFYFFTAFRKSRRNDILLYCSRYFQVPKGRHSINPSQLRCVGPIPAPLCVVPYYSATCSTTSLRRALSIYPPLTGYQSVYQCNIYIITPVCNGKNMM